MPITDFAAARADLDFAHHHLAGPAQALGFNRLAGLEEIFCASAELSENRGEAEQETT